MGDELVEGDAGLLDQRLLLGRRLARILRPIAIILVSSFDALWRESLGDQK